MHPAIDTAVYSEAGQVATLPLKGHVVKAGLEVKRINIPGLPQLTEVSMCVHQGVVVFISPLIKWYDVLIHVVRLARLDAVHQQQGVTHVGCSSGPSFAMTPLPSNSSTC